MARDNNQSDKRYDLMAACKVWRGNARPFDESINLKLIASVLIFTRSGQYSHNIVIVGFRSF